MFEVNPSGQAFALRLLICFVHELGIDVDTTPLHARVHPRSGQRNQAVARPEVHDDVVITKLSQRQHSLGHFGRARMEKRESLL